VLMASVFLILIGAIIYFTLGVLQQRQ